MSSQATDWEARYQAGTTGWQRPTASPVLAAWIADGILAPGRILVPGAGRGAEPVALARAGFDVTVVDIAPSAIAFQQDQLAEVYAHAVLGQPVPGVLGQAVLHDLLTWQPATPLDAIYEQTCLCALPPALWEEYAARLASWLRPGGTLAAMFMQTGRDGGPPFHCDIDRMRALFPEARWRWPKTLAVPLPHPTGLAEQPAVLIRQPVDKSGDSCG